MRRKFWIFPVFIPNMGCLHRCSFCDQGVVTGVSTEQVTIGRVETLFNSVRPPGEKDGKKPVRQIAFFGGSFTQLPMEAQRQYLDWAAQKVRGGLVDSLRFSTRPDALSDGELTFLSKYPIRTVEIGVQSLNDEVLRTVSRGHTAEDSERAVKRIVSMGWEAGVQLMPGLPGETREDFLHGVLTVSGWGVRYARLYPAVVLKGTRLARDYREERYHPLSLEEAVAWCMEAVEILERAGVSVIRMGLPASDLLRHSVVAGPYHPAFGFLVQSGRFHLRLREELRRFPGVPREVHIRIATRDLPLLMGEHGRAWKVLRAAFPDRELAYRLDHRLPRGTLRLESS